MSSLKSKRVSKNRKPPAKISVVKSSSPLKFLDSVLCHQPQLGPIIRAKPCAVSKHPASEDRTTPMSPDVPYVFPDYHTSACSIQCLAQTLKNIEVAREHVDHLGRIILHLKPAQFLELIVRTRQKLNHSLIPVSSVMMLFLQVSIWKCKENTRFRVFIYHCSMEFSRNCWEDHVLVLNF